MDSCLRFGRLFILSTLAFVAVSAGGLHPRAAQACPIGGCTNASLYGDYAISGTAPGSPNSGFVGLLHADGAGNVTSTSTVVDDSTNPVTVTNRYLCNGTYSINSDGTGTVLLYAHSTAMCSDVSPPTVTLAIVLEDGGHAFRAINTNNGGVGLGSGRLQ
jgi:hypothetical protein